MREPRLKRRGLDRFYLGSRRELDEFDRLDELCRSKGWRLFLRLCERTESDENGVRSVGRIEELDVVEVIPDSGFEYSDGRKRRNERELIARASIRPDERIGICAEALREQMTRAGLFVYDQERPA